MKQYNCDVCAFGPCSIIVGYTPYFCPHTGKFIGKKVGGPRF